MYFSSYRKIYTARDDGQWNVELSKIIPDGATLHILATYKMNSCDISVMTYLFGCDLMSLYHEGLWIR